MYITANPGSNDAKAVLHLANSWQTTNDADKIGWQVQQDLSISDAAERERLNQEAAELAAEKLKLDQGHYHYRHTEAFLGHLFELFHWTNAGLTKAKQLAAATNNNSLTFITKDGAMSLISTAATRDSRAVKADKDISWDDFCIAVP
ncbi:hypothetical protein B0H34DRAFT_802078 [Crassisporium funariophilum]|nr:hypothetical protein B0H34DRAFT_802078 [Crassisporium funariophilum]